MPTVFSIIQQFGSIFKYIFKINNPIYTEGELK